MKTSKLYNLFATHTGDRPIAPGMEIVNDFEPLNSNDTPSPPEANFYQGDDYIYYHVNGNWKRSSIQIFTHNNQ